MTDYYLKFTSEEQAAAALEGYEGSVDVIGTIYERTGGTDDEPTMTAISGWHVNLRGPESAAFQEYTVEVNTPYRVWA